MEAQHTNDETDLIPTRHSLLSRLKDWKDEQSWKAFFDTYWRLIYSTALRAGLSDAEAQDVVQETLISVSKSMPNFHYDPDRGSFKGWLKRLISWRIKRQLSRRLPVKQRAEGNRRTSTGTGTLEKIADPASLATDTRWDEEWEKNLVAVAIERVKKKADPKQFQIFDYFVLQGIPAPRVAAALRVNRGRVYVAKHRITNLIKSEVASLQAKPF